MGHNVNVLPSVSIGDGAVIGTGSVVTKDVLPYAMRESRGASRRPAGFESKLLYQYNRRILLQIYCRNSKLLTPPLNLGLPVAWRYGLTRNQGGDYGPDCPPAHERQYQNRNQRRCRRQPAGSARRKRSCFANGG